MTRIIVPEAATINSPPSNTAPASGNAANVSSETHF
jgi:hypothetical protein